jgi:hypothetical protein
MKNKTAVSQNLLNKEKKNKKSKKKSKNLEKISKKNLNHFKQVTQKLL